MVEKALRVYVLGWNWSKEQELAEAYTKPCQTSKVECFAEMVNGSTMLTVFAKHFLLNVCQSSEYGFAIIKVFHSKIAVKRFRWKRKTFWVREYSFYKKY